ncbi:MAG: hypothetical protein HY438_02435 [DPANN group archaeon]|nr:hypothetical protein [DPANN group archaeon]
MAITLQVGGKRRELEIPEPFFSKSARAGPILLFNNNIYEVVDSLDAGEEADATLEIGAAVFPIVYRESISQQEKRFFKVYEKSFQELLKELEPVKEIEETRKKIATNKLWQDIEQHILEKEKKSSEDLAEKFAERKMLKTNNVGSIGNPLISILAIGLKVGDSAIEDALSIKTKKVDEIEPDISADFEEFFRKRRAESRKQIMSSDVDLCDDELPVGKMPSLEDILALDRIQFPIIAKIFGGKNICVIGGMKNEKVWLLEKGDGDFRFKFNNETFVLKPYGFFDKCAEVYVNTIGKLLEDRVKRLEKFMKINANFLDIEMAKIVRSGGRVPEDFNDIGIQMEEGKVLIYCFIKPIIIVTNDGKYVPLPQKPADSNFSKMLFIPKPPQDIKFGFYMYYSEKTRRYTWAGLVNYEPQQLKFIGHYRSNVGFLKHALNRGLCAPNLQKKFQDIDDPVAFLVTARGTLVSGWSRRGEDHAGYDTMPHLFETITKEKAEELDKLGKYHLMREPGEEPYCRMPSKMFCVGPYCGGK